MSNALIQSRHGPATGPGHLAQPRPGIPRQLPAARSKAAYLGFVLLCIFDLALPKGGLKLGNLPLTWGYLFLALCSGVGFFGLFARKHIAKVPIVHFALFFLPATIMVIVKGEVFDLPLAPLVLHLVVFGALPLMVLGILAPQLEMIPSEDLGPPIVWAVRFTVIWGIMNFFVHLLTKKFIEIPYITVNIADVGTIYEKMNARSGIMKLVSTYNNGNIYGVCMLIMAPVYFFFEKRRLFLALFLVAMIATLSRTVWFGTVFVIILMMLNGQIRATNINIWLGAAVGVLAIIAILPVLGWTPDDLVDSDLGGRFKYFNHFEMTGFGNASLSIPEITYFGFLESFGAVGMLFPLGGMLFTPLYALSRWPELSPLRKAAAAGAAGYLGTSAIDGAFIFPPTIVLFLFMCALVYRRGLYPAYLPGQRLRLARQAAAEEARTRRAQVRGAGRGAGRGQ